MEVRNINIKLCLVTFSGEYPLAFRINRSSYLSSNLAVLPPISGDHQFHDHTSCRLCDRWYLDSRAPDYIGCLSSSVAIFWSDQTSYYTSASLFPCG